MLQCNCSVNAIQNIKHEDNKIQTQKGSNERLFIVECISSSHSVSDFFLFMRILSYNLGWELAKATTKRKRNVLVSRLWSCALIEGSWGNTLSQRGGGGILDLIWIWNRTRPRALVQKQHRNELISAQIVVGLNKLFTAKWLQMKPLSRSKLFSPVQNNQTLELLCLAVNTSVARTFIASSNFCHIYMYKTILGLMFKYSNQSDGKDCILAVMDWRV